MEAARSPEMTLQSQMSLIIRSVVESGLRGAHQFLSVRSAY